MIKGTIYDFFPVQTMEGSEEFESCNTWHWKYFGWWFEMYTFMRGITAKLMNVDLPFIIKVKDNVQNNTDTVNS